MQAALADLEEEEQRQRDAMRREHEKTAITLQEAVDKVFHDERVLWENKFTEWGTVIYTARISESGLSERGYNGYFSLRELEDLRDRAEGWTVKLLCAPLPGWAWSESRQLQFQKEFRRK